MGFNKVYKCLMEMFPQIDTRLLKAVAIEHSKDADSAANVVLTEILPYLSKRSLPVDQGASSSTPMGQSCTAEHEERSTLRQRIVARRNNKTLCSSMELGSIASGSSTNTDAGSHDSGSTYLSKELMASTVSPFYDSQLFGNNESEEVILLGMTQESGVEFGSNKVSTDMPSALSNGEVGNADLSQVRANTESSNSVPIDKDQGVKVNVDPKQTPFCIPTLNAAANGSLTDWQDFDTPGIAAADTFGTSHPVESSLDCVLQKVAQTDPSSVQEHTSDVPECGLQSETGAVTTITDCGKTDSSDLIYKQENPMSEKFDIEDEMTINTFVTRSGQICRIDILEDMIENARKNKKTLFTATESVMNLIREVETQEKAAEEAKAKVEQGGLDILVQVEELKQMLAHAKEANDMHAGEIYGEKAILATEARELQNRLLFLSEERDKSLAILDEMRERLEARLAAAQEMRKAAEQEKLEKEESARNSLAEQEAIMEKVVQESKILQIQAEENSKLREFLMDRGGVVDSLQGEISVICQDVKLLKEKFDERVPLSKSVSSSQTTCILASSSSSVKSMATLLAEQGVPVAETPKKVSPTPSIDAQSPKSRLEDGSGDGWDIFEKDAKLSYEAWCSTSRLRTPSIDAQSPKSRLEDGSGDVGKELSDEGWDILEKDAELSCEACKF